MAKHLLGHACELPEDLGGLARLPPNAPFYHRFARWFRKFLSPNPNLAIVKRNYRNASQINAETRRHAQSKFFYIIHPYSSMEFYRELYFLFIGTWQIITSPLISSFSWVIENKPKLAKGSQDISALQYPEVFIFLLQTFWIVSCFFVGYKEREGKLNIQMNHLKIVKRYLTSYFLIDLLMLFPEFPPWDYQFWNITLWIHWIVLVRCPTIIKFLRRFLKDLKLPQEIITCIILTVINFFFIHIFTCFFYLLPIMGDDGRHELYIANSSLLDKPPDIIYVGCFSMVQTHFWGVGVMELEEPSNMEQIVLTLTMIVGRVWGLVIIASILRLFTISSLSESKYEQYLIQLKTFISHNNLPKEMEERIVEYYEHKYQRHFFNEKGIYNSLSHYLRQELMLFRARGVINKVQYFKYFPRSIVATVMEKCKIMVYMNNDIVFNVGDLMDHVSFISYGTLAAHNDDRFEMVHLTDGDQIGARAVLTYHDCTYDWTYISIETTEIYKISVKTFREIVYSKPDYLRAFQKVVDERNALWARMIAIAKAQGKDLLSELKRENVLERPRIRTRFFEQ